MGLSLRGCDRQTIEVFAGLENGADQPIPRVTREDVERVVARDFPEANVRQALETLDGYESESGDPNRVHLAVLKLACGNLDQLHRKIETAKINFRDVFAYAEYPRYTREIGFKDIPEPLKRGVMEDDWKQYQTWLNKKGY